MFVKLTHSGSRSYVQLVEAYRDDAGRPKQRTVATLGRLETVDTPVIGAARLMLTLWRWMRRNCASACSGLSSDLADLSRCRMTRCRIKQAAILAALDLKNPTLNTQLTLL